MYFTEREKQIYEAPEGRGKFDPLRVDRLLQVETRGRLHLLVSLRNMAAGGLGDVSPEGKAQTALEAADAELQLADAARKVFNLPPFPECTDADALEVLYHFLGWMEGKGETAGTPETTAPTHAKVTSDTSPGFSVRSTAGSPA